MVHIWDENGHVKSSNRIIAGWHVSYIDCIYDLFLQNLFHLICLLNVKKK